MLTQLNYIKTKLGKRFASFFLLIFIFNGGIGANAQNAGSRLSFDLRANLNMTTITGASNAGLKLGATVGVGSLYKMNENSSFLAELLYSTGGSSSSQSIDTTGIKLKIYDKTHLNYLVIPIVYQYYFTGILGLEIGPQLGFCLGGKEKFRTGNNSWTSIKLNSGDFNVFDFGVIIGIYTKNITQEDNLFISLRACFGLTNVMKDMGANKNINIQLGLGYIIGR